MQTWRRFWALDLSSQALIIETAATLLATKVGLHVLGLRRWKSFLDFFAPRTNSDISNGADFVGVASRIARLQLATARHLRIVRLNCLEQSLTLINILRRRGIYGELRLGARKTADRFEAHAWVELNGAALTMAGDRDGAFTPFDGAFAFLGIGSR
jgi:hypothetical protein